MPAVKKSVRKSKKVEAPSSNVEEVVEVTDTENVEVTENTTTSNSSENVEPVVKHVDQSLTDESNEVLELIKMSQGILSQLNKSVRASTISIRRMEKDINKFNRKRDKNKNTKGQNGNKALKQLKPIYTQTMTDFFKDNQDLKDRNDVIICETLTYESDGTLLVSRDQALRMVTSYIRVNELQQYPEDKRRIKMDSTLKSLFPELVEVKKGKTIVQEENCYYSTLMGAISKHFKQ